MLTRYIRPTLATLVMSLTLLVTMTTSAAGSAPAAFPCPYCFFGIAGGGTIQTDTGEAHFAFLATEVRLPDESESVIAGQLTWTTTLADGSTLTLRSVIIDEYGWIEDVDGGRWARGELAVDGTGEIPFVVRAVDGGGPGGTVDTIELTVGSAIEGSASGDFGYHAEGTLTSGDLALVGPPDDDATPAP